MEINPTCSDCAQNNKRSIREKSILAEFASIQPDRFAQGSNYKGFNIDFAPVVFKRFGHEFVAIEILLYPRHLL
jgi:hypothetical protein